MAIFSSTKVIFTVLVLVWLFPTVNASSISSVSVAEMTDQSEVIFEGSVSGLKNVVGEGKGNVHTIVTIEVLDMIKGDPQTRSVELSYLGGKTADGMMMIVTDMHMPALGEHGIYFVEETEGKIVHPLSGWDQGHFLVKSPVPGVHKGFVTTHKGAPVFDVDPAQVAASRTLSKGRATGIIVAPLSEGAEPVTVDEFKLMLREMVR